MARTGEHVQCKLRKGTAEQVAWIPKSCALLGKVVDLDDPEHGEALEWKVIEVGTMPLDSKWINDRSRDYLLMKKMTDI